jgi:hypothetical protein
MKMVIAPVGALLLLALARVVLADLPRNERGIEMAALEHRLVGTWRGEYGCTGNFLFRADGTYELRGKGPGGNNSAGAWKVRWDVLPGTLVLTCRTSEIPEEVGESTEMKLIRLDQRSFAVQQTGLGVLPYTRVKN